MTREEWLRLRSFRGTDFDPERLAAARTAAGTSVSVVLPCLNVADTVGDIIAAVRDAWMGPRSLVDEIVVVDSRSTDATIRIAEQEGAAVHQDHDILPDAGTATGKGEAMWKSLYVTDGDLILWLDSDVHDFDPAFVPGMLGPLLTNPDIGYVKALYARALGATEDGGRVTEICARPLVNLFYPDLAVLAQPLSGEQAGRRELLERVPFFTGYAVELGLLIDLLGLVGLEGLAQVDLGRRAHVNQPTSALGAMAYAITQAVMRRVAEDGRAPAELAAAGPYTRPVRDHGRWVLSESQVTPLERPPMLSIPDYARPSAA